MSEEARENLRALGDTAALLSGNLAQLRSDVAGGLVSTRAAAAMDDALPTLGDSFLGMEQEFPEMPTLVYDGPFSASVAEREPHMIKDAREVTQDAAALVAAGFLGMRSNSSPPPERARARFPSTASPAGTTP